jgi:cell division protein FtsI (penicillin-binding protein 3)
VPPPRASRAPRRGSTRSRSAPSANRRRRKSPRSRSPARLVATLAVLLLLFGGTAVRLVVLQIVESPAYARLAAQQREREILFPARRGAVLDRKGEQLAISVDLQTIFTDPAHVENVRRTAAELAGLLDQPARSIEEKLRGAVPGDRFEYLARQVDPAVAEKVRALNLPGVFFRDEPKRLYPFGRIAAHILGFVNIEGDALAGIEQQYDDVLRGRPGLMKLEQDPAGRPLPQAEFEYERPNAGRSLFLTIDKDIQYFTQLTLEEAVRRYHARAASAVIMRPKTGEILAMANVPDFDPNEFTNATNDDRRNRVVTDVYEPGSVFKIVTASAALDTGAVKPSSKFVVPYSMPYADRVIHDSHAHGTEVMTMTEIIQQSSNVGTVKIGLELGGERLDSYIRRFGFGRRTGLDFPGESPGLVLDRSRWSGSTIANLPIGQGIAVTPLQMTAAFATLANEGMWIEPKLVHAITNARGHPVPSPIAGGRRVVKKKTARTMLRILAGAVSQGTGVEARIPGYAVAGKTGTAQKPEAGGYGDSYVASFGGIVPASHPQLVALVVLDDPSPIWGGATAAPTFKTIVTYALRHLGIAPMQNAARAVEQIEQAPADSSFHD